MLNEDPRPDDLPDGPTGYAALPPDYAPPSPSSGGAVRGRSWQRPAIAAVAVVASSPSSSSPSGASATRHPSRSRS